MSTDHLHRILSGRSAEPVPRPRPKFFPILRWLAAALDRAGQRRALAELTDDQLADIGLSRREAFRETSKPFWKP